MYKIPGFLLIMLGCSGLGIWYSSQFLLQVHNLQKLCHILELLMGQVRYGRCTLPECCKQLAERLDEPYHDTFQKIYEESNNNEGEYFNRICERVLKEGLSKMVISKEHKELFISCFAKCGFEDNTMQIRNVEMIKEELEKALQDLSEKNSSRCRLAVSLGTMSGLLLIILFL